MIVECWWRWLLMVYVILFVVCAVGACADSRGCASVCLARG